MTNSKTFYLLEEKDINEIDGLTQALNLAIGEILSSKTVKFPSGKKLNRKNFNELFYKAIEEKQEY